MQTTERMAPAIGLDRHGIHDVGTTHWNPVTPVLYEQTVKRGEGVVAHRGPLLVRTGRFTGRTPKDKFIVREPGSDSRIWWAGNKPFSPEDFDRLHRRVTDYLRGREVFVQDCYVGADPAHRRSVRVITEMAWHSLFTRNLFIQRPVDEHVEGEPDFTVISVPHFHAEPERDHTRSDAFVVLNFAEHLILIGGTEYAGEIKKSLFTVMQYLLPLEGVVSMHCSANVGESGDTALFFGLSGTGKTTLSTDPDRQLIGDDETGWSDRGIFNFEGGCYAKVIRLSPESEPEIYQTTRQFGTILENVIYDPDTRRLDLNDESITENTRAAYPLSHIPNSSHTGLGDHPHNVFLLTADAFGVLPPISRLTTEQAMYHFLSGYTAKVAGTEVGLTEPEATFSTCFGAPFLALPPEVYANLLGKRVNEHGTRVWLVNTGWIGGPAGSSDRVPIAYTRAMIRAALSGALADVPTTPDPIFGVLVPERCPNVPTALLHPRRSWSDPEAYDRQAHRLAGMFNENFQQFVGHVPAEVVAAGPSVD
ncbi:MAG TPA: phosphoenolpyruvate carboxykinase (ATP) [Thermomicrobiaceae bacterium]|nr:phosphoenolpyruvate carboxykinase (ATP) [Thermomicrobiaceae bacterium]